VVASILVGAESLFCYCIVNVKAQSVSLLSPHPTSCLTLLYALSKEPFLFLFLFLRTLSKTLLWLVRAESLFVIVKVPAFPPSYFMTHIVICTL
jgi:hypothetical protein